MIRVVTPEEAMGVIDDALLRLKTMARRIKSQGPRQAGMRMIQLAKGLAPVKTGHLQSNIKGNTEGKGYRVTSSVTQGNFAYNEWINMGPRLLTSYGRTYLQTNMTGVPGFFDIARGQAMTEFRNVVISETKSYRVVS